MTVKTLALASGDLVVGPAGHRTISGAAKIRQELALWLSEVRGADRFHPDLGSVLGEFLGQPLTPDSELLLQAEVGRVVRQYIATQAREVLQDHLGQRTSRYDASDVVVGIVAIDSKIDYDKVRVSATLLTKSGAQVPISRTVTA